jgi:hypothetical protein
MPIPTDREHLVELVTSRFEKLDRELREGGSGIGELHCVDDWTVKDLLAVRAWWTARVVAWIEAGQRGEDPELPAAGYGWNETPRLNNDIAGQAKSESYEEVLARLRTAYERVLSTIDALNDEELLETGAFEWADKWPLARWISINTARQYETARTFVRRAVQRA